MKLQQHQIKQIREEFAKMQTKLHFLYLMNKVKPLIYGEKTVPFKMKQLMWYSSPKLSGNRYTNFKVKKKSGADRTIHAPVDGLKAIQTTLSFILQCVFEPHHAAMGFVRNKSIIDNAKLHTGSKYIYNIDLKDFFPSIDQARVWKCLQLKPFLLESDKDSVNEISLEEAIIKYNPIKIEAGELEFLSLEDDSLKSLPWNQFLNLKNRGRRKFADIIASLCCAEMDVERMDETGKWRTVKRNVLPQGAPTSPILTNVICQRLDFLLTGVAKRFGLKYSRYADDITFSSMHNVYQADSDFIKELHRIIAEQGFHIKESKTRLQKEGYRQEVTGLLVNEKVNVQKRYIKQLRMWLYYWERYGYERAYGYFIQQYLRDKAHIVKGKPNMANVISGKLDYLKMVKGQDNDTYLKLRERLNILTNKTDFIADLLSLWEIEGIEKAMENYYQNKSLGK